MGALVNKDIQIVRLGQLLQCTVVLGSPGKDCQGHGICLVLPNRLEAKFKCASVPATLLFYDNMVRLDIEKNKVNEEELQKHFSGTCFRLESDFHFPAWVMRRIQAGRDACIPQGNYIIMERNGYLCIEMLLKTKDEACFYIKQG